MTNPILQDLVEVMRLREEVRSAMSWQEREDALQNFYGYAASFIDRRHAAIEKAVRDAERYRWYRKNHNADLLAEDVVDDAMAQDKDRG